tara:strand:- start:116 stop:517 length:402 start_codon:yes stop_codon:yes gene_type:complete
MAWYPGKRIVEAAKKVRKKSRARTAKKRLKKDLNLNVTAKQAEKYGKVRKGVANVKLTEGGAYPSYKKKSKAAGSFRSAFAKNCKGKGSGDTFSWDGRSYSCARASDKKKAKPKNKIVSYDYGEGTKERLVKS